MVCSVTRGDPLITRDAVELETPARAATSSRVGIQGCAAGAGSFITSVSCCPSGAFVGPRLGGGTSTPYAIAPCGSFRDGVPLDQPRHPPSAVLDGAHLRVVVDVHDPEALAVSVAPLEVVEQRPHEVAAQVDTLAHRPVGGGEVASQVVDA